VSSWSLETGRIKERKRSLTFGGKVYPRCEDYRNLPFSFSGNKNIF
jgi:hypothetical protein